MLATKFNNVLHCQSVWESGLMGKERELTKRLEIEPLEVYHSMKNSLI